MCKYQNRSIIEIQHHLEKVDTKIVRTTRLWYNIHQVRS